MAGYSVESDSAFKDVDPRSWVVEMTIDTVDLSAWLKALGIDAVFLSVGVARVDGAYHDVGVKLLGDTRDIPDTASIEVHRVEGRKN